LDRPSNYLRSYPDFASARHERLDLSEENLPHFCGPALFLRISKYAIWEAVLRTSRPFVLIKAMRFLRILLFSFLVVFLAVIGFGLLAPSDWDVERSVSINAKPEKIYPFVANFKTGWPQWSSYDLEDHRITYTYSGPDEGVGARRSWVGGNIGDGSQVITHADPRRGVAFDIQMIKTNFAIKGTFRFEPMVDDTKVTWRHYGNVGNNPLSRYSALTMDRIMGDEFEKSLGLLKTKVEAAP
jgi:hypothetical protein